MRKGEVMGELQKKIEEMMSKSDDLFAGLDINCEPVAGAEDLFEFQVKNREDAPVFVTSSDGQILCISYLFDESQISAEKKSEMMESMLELNIPIPLSAFAKIDDRYALFGALSMGSDVSELAEEIVTLSGNWIDAVEALSDYLV